LGKRPRVVYLSLSKKDYSTFHKFDIFESIGDTVNMKIIIPEGKISDFCHKWKILEFAIFGSALREDFGPNSDVDILVTFHKDAHWSLYDWVDMIDELKAIFGREVHLLSKSGLRNPFRRQKILTTRQIMYAA
jgi:predicted nucleotidyltransferase